MFSNVQVNLPSIISDKNLIQGRSTVYSKIQSKYKNPNLYNRKLINNINSYHNIGSKYNLANEKIKSILHQFKRSSMGSIGVNYSDLVHIPSPKGVNDLYDDIFDSSIISSNPYYSKKKSSSKLEFKDQNYEININSELLFDSASVIEYDVDFKEESDFDNEGIKEGYELNLSKNYNNNHLNNQYREYNNLNKLSNLEISTPRKITSISSNEVLPSTFNRKYITSKLPNYSYEYSNLEDRDIQQSKLIKGGINMNNDKYKDNKFNNDKKKLNLNMNKDTDNSTLKKEHFFYSYKDNCNSNIKIKLKDYNKFDIDDKIKSNSNIFENENIQNNLEVFMKQYNSYSNLANKKYEFNNLKPKLYNKNNQPLIKNQSYLKIYNKLESTDNNLVLKSENDKLYTKYQKYVKRNPKAIKSSVSMDNLLNNSYTDTNYDVKFVNNINPKIKNQLNRENNQNSKLGKKYSDLSLDVTNVYCYNGMSSNKNNNLSTVEKLNGSYIKSEIIDDKVSRSNSNTKLYREDSSCSIIISDADAGKLLNFRDNKLYKFNKLIEGGNEINKKLNDYVKNNFRRNKFKSVTVNMSNADLKTSIDYRVMI